MAQDYSKKEIVKHVNELIAKIKNKTYKSPFSQDFAEVYIEDAKSTENGERIPNRTEKAPPPMDEKRVRFREMRRIADNIGYIGGVNDRLQTVLFYKQAKFMVDFEDDYTGNAYFNMYFPTYQMMSYEQLRTYFTWRSNVRRGIIKKTDYSYAFVYCYELINNIGVEDCEDGLSKLAFLWDEYRQFEKNLDRYMNLWVRDYYITNDFAEPFDCCIQKNERLQRLYKPSAAEDYFDCYYPYSSYKVKKSAFYTPQTEKMIIACFNTCIKTLDKFLRGQNAEVEDLIFFTKGSRWVPFSKALYCASARKIDDKVVKISDTEKYRCENGRFTSSKNRIVKENGRALIGYLLKRIEQFLRKAKKYKYKLGADQKKISMDEIGKILNEPQSLFTQIDAAIFEYYRGTQRKVITVDTQALKTIRANALMIQEKLIVADEEAPEPEQVIFASEIAPESEIPLEPEPVLEAENAPEPNDIWEMFAQSLSDEERTAARMVLRGAATRELRDYLIDSGMMLEVLIDNINQKAIDAVSDSVFELSDEVTVFDEYKDDLKRVIDIECQ